MKIANLSLLCACAALLLVAPAFAAEKTHAHKPHIHKPHTHKTHKTHTNSIGMDFVRVPDGTFHMGCGAGEAEDCDADGTPGRETRIDQPFYLGKFEVTQAQWESVMGTNPSRFKDPDRPVENVSLDDAQEFIRKLNAKEGHERYRLPTEAEWEYAARAGASTAFHFGDETDLLGDYAWHGDNSGGTTHPVGLKQPNAWGLHDMFGNVSELVHDRQDGPAAGAAAPPQASDTDGISVLRGGSWDLVATSFRASERADLVQGRRYMYVGFRIAFSSGD